MSRRFRLAFLILPVVLMGTGLVHAAVTEDELAVLDATISSAKNAGEPTVALGDQIFTLGQLESQRNGLAEEAGIPVPKASTGAGIAKWTGGNVYYKFDSTVTTDVDAARKMRAFREACADWATFANLQFIEQAGASPGQPYISVSQGGTNGGSSQVGMAGVGQLMRIGTNSWTRLVLAHEIGHALGLLHEHQRSDRNTYVTINTANLSSPTDPNFVIISTSSNNSAYDYLSLMHYDRRSSSTNGNDTIVPKDSAYLDLIGTQTDRVLSKLDRQVIATMYGARSSGTVVTNTKDSGTGSLRAAIYKAWDTASSASPVTITFNIPTTDPGYNASQGTFTIEPIAIMTRLGAYTRIDGTTQPDTNSQGPEIILSGVNGNPYVYEGLTVSDGNCLIKGLNLGNFSSTGIRITSNNNVIIGNYIGLSYDGMSATPNSTGITLTQGASNNIIGGNSFTDANFVSGNTSNGITIGSASSAFGTATGNSVVGNYIGLNYWGDATIGHGIDGITLSNNSASTTVAKNFIAGFSDALIFVSGSNTNTFTANWLGITQDFPGDYVTSTANYGISIFFASGNTIGGASADSRNIIANYGIDDVNINTSTNTTVYGNYMGLGPDGIAALGRSSAAGIYVSASMNTTIGGGAPGQRNIIAGTMNYGIQVAGTSPGTIIRGNYIGLDNTGVNAITSGGTGIKLTGGAGTVIGGETPGAGNVIGGNIAPIDAQDAAVNNLVIKGNILGSNIFAEQPSGANIGINLLRGTGNVVIGGEAAGAANILRGTNAVGIQLSSNQGTTISRNSIVGYTFRTIFLDGANSSQAAPNVTNAALGPTGTTITGTVTGAANRAHTLEFFARNAADSADSLRYYLGSLSVTTDGSGNATFTSTLPVVVPAVAYVLANSTDTVTHNTSQNSAGIHPTTTDRDGDGLPAAYEALYPGKLSDSNPADAALDTDGDGFSNYDEFKLGTSPTNGSASERFYLNVTAGTDQTALLQLPTRANHIYNISRSASLSGPWMPFLTNLQGTGTTFSITDSTTDGASQYYYRASTAAP